MRPIWNIFCCTNVINLYCCKSFSHICNRINCIWTILVSRSISIAISLFEIVTVNIPRCYSFLVFFIPVISVIVHIPPFLFFSLFFWYLYMISLWPRLSVRLIYSSAFVFMLYIYICVLIFHEIKRERKRLENKTAYIYIHLSNRGEFHFLSELTDLFRERDFFSRHSDIHREKTKTKKIICVHSVTWT